jgi:hypothetical protein
MRWVGREAYMGENTNYEILARKSEIKRPLGRSRLRSDDNIKKDLKALG